MHRRTLALTLVLLARWTPCAAEVKPKPYLMASMGDSITAALFGGTALTSSTQAFVTMDDVESAFLGSRLFEKKYTLSWSSGKDIPSHFVQLRDYLKAKEGAGLEVLNTATTGNKAEDLIAQARTVAAAMAGGDYRALKYATILVGANDVCFGGGPTGTPEGVMRDALKAALGLLAPGTAPTNTAPAPSSSPARTPPCAKPSSKRRPSTPTCAWPTPTASSWSRSRAATSPPTASTPTRRPRRASAWSCGRSSPGSRLRANRPWNGRARLCSRPGRRSRSASWLRPDYSKGGRPALTAPRSRG
ncbi:MAG: hypothetical protein HYV15_00545 [Elusimicrobia bacterium]|nr:hypothetical protein [Elusimicrobiota bacterium]